VTWSEAQKDMTLMDSLNLNVKTGEDVVFLRPTKPLPVDVDVELSLGPTVRSGRQQELLTRIN